MDSIIHLFDHTIKPILLYGSEIWGTPNINSCNVRKPDYTLLKSFANMSCDKMHINFLKYVLGVHKKASNEAVYGELGRFPLYFDVICNYIKFYQRLISENVSKLLSAAFNESKALCVNNKASWVSSVHHCFKYLDISEADFSNKKLVNFVKVKLVNMYKTNWCLNISCTGGQLRTYSLFKHRFCREQYFRLIKDKDVRTFFTKFRISARNYILKLEDIKKSSSR